MNRLLLIFLLIVALPVLSRSDEPSLEKSEVVSESGYLQLPETILARIKTEIYSVIKIRPGMRISELRDYIEKNNAEAHSAKPPPWETRERHPPAFAYPELRICVFLPMNESHDSTTGELQSLTYFINGWTQFWIDLGVEDGKVKNVFVTLGNMENMLSPFWLDGEGEHVGYLVPRRPSTNLNEEDPIDLPIK